MASLVWAWIPLTPLSRALQEAQELYCYFHCSFKGLSSPSFRACPQVVGQDLTAAWFLTAAHKEVGPFMDGPLAYVGKGLGVGGFFPARLPGA